MYKLDKKLKHDENLAIEQIKNQFTKVNKVILNSFGDGMKDVKLEDHDKLKNLIIENLVD